MSTLNYKSIYTPKLARPIKRLAAYLIDIVMVLVIFTGVMFLLSEMFDYQGVNAKLEQLYIDTGVKIADDKGVYDFCDIKNTTCEQSLKNLYAMDLFYELFNSIQGFLIYAPIISIFVPLLILEFILPMIFKNGQTLGMKLFNIALISKNGIKVKPIQVFVRFLFGKFIINGIVPVLGVMYIFISDGAGITGAMLLLLYLIANFACYGVGQNKTFVPDALAGCYPIDTQEQIFFDTVEELAAAKAAEQRTYMKKR